MAPLPLAALAMACGGSAPPASNATSTTMTGSPGPSASTAAQTAAPASTGATEATYEDTAESAGPVAMTVELARGTPKSSYPKKTVDEASCWKAVSPTGFAQKDFDALTASCGGPTGLLEYAKPVAGRLHATKDKRDTYALDLQKGLCYRYFAVADQGITDLDILVQKPGGALVADDKQNGPVAIIETDKTWCMDQDARYEFHVEIDGPGTGGYVFGVWARPRR